jgi:hypothetical protein
MINCQSALQNMDATNQKAAELCVIASECFIENALRPDKRDMWTQKF